MSTENQEVPEYLDEAPVASSVVPVESPSEKIETVEPIETPVRERKEQNVYLDGPVSTPTTDEDTVAISLPSDSDKRVDEILMKTPNVNMVGTEQGARWASVLKDSIGMTPGADVFVSTLEDPEADFHQFVSHQGVKVASAEVRLKERQNSVFDGEMAVLRTISHLGLGGIWNTALWNTGISVTFKPPAEEDLVELYRQLTSDAIQIGRYSYGLVYANTTAYTVSRMCQFAAQHIYRISANPEQINSGNILNHISAQDINTFLWGLACTMFPKGFVYERPCTINPEKCQHVVRETLNLRKLCVVNRRALTDVQKAHMAENRSAQKLTLQDLERYRSEMVRAGTHRVVINEGHDNEIAFNLRSPSIEEYIQTGHRWIDDMVDTADKALGKEANANLRNRLVDQRARASIMRQYSHWVDSVEIDSNVIKDRASIEKVLASISGDRHIRTEFNKAVSKYIDTSSVSVVGIPTYECPACGAVAEHPHEYPYKTSMIPLDVIQLFFVLITQKHRELVNR